MNLPDFEAILKATGEVGYIQEDKDSLIYVEGLPTARVGELVVFESGGLGQVYSLSERAVEVLVLENFPAAVGTRVARTGKFMDVPVGQHLLGQTVDPLCRPLSGGGSGKADSRTVRLLDTLPLGINMRRRITNHFETGVALVDMLVPLGKGQRELVVGDRKTGKTTFLLQTVVNQARAGVVCIYCAIGKKMADIVDLKDYFSRMNVSAKIIIVAAGSSAPSGLVFLAPYTAMSVAEYFRDVGADSIVILDDMTTHAKYYREIALTGKRFPGRESYPGDIFYLHSKILERAGNFATPAGERSITCLPVAESLEGDISGYIQTNLMSMTDGHVFFDNDLFVRGRRPAINPFLSVTRVGFQTQSQTQKDIHREISVVLSLYERSAQLSHFGSSLQETMKLSLVTGEKILAFFDQELNFLIPRTVQTVLFGLLWVNYWPEGKTTVMKREAKNLVRLYEEDSSTRAYIDNLSAQGENFNGFLGKISAELEKISSLLKQ